MSFVAVGSEADDAGLEADERIVVLVDCCKYEVDKLVGTGSATSAADKLLSAA